jgi:transcriptional regulator with XRE-family HTH domain
MRERIIKFLEIENLSSSKFADDIGVQRSSISHILSGRNNPSFDFIQKILTKYKTLNAEWLIMGTGNMLKTIKQGNLFENNAQETLISDIPISNTEKLSSNEDNLIVNKEIYENEENKVSNERINKTTNIIVEKIITIYSDKTFDIYLPAKYILI